MKTALGQIAGLLAAEPQEPTPLQRRMGEVGRTLGAAAGILVLLVFFFGVWRGESVLDMLLMAISLAVAAIPEGLPAIVTIVLALGVQRMAARRAIIRRLPAVETLGDGHGHRVGQDRHADAQPHDRHAPGDACGGDGPFRGRCGGRGLRPERR